MNNLSSKLKTPAWRRVVAELAKPAPDDRAFLTRLLSVLHQVAGARQAVLFAVPVAEGDSPENAEPNASLVWPPGQGSGQQPALQAEHAIKSAARAAAGSGEMEVFGLESEDSPYYESSNAGYVCAIPIAPKAEQQIAPAGVVTLLLDQRSAQALQASLAMIEVLAGYVHLHGAQQALHQMRSAGAALDLAARLIAAINTAPNFKGATMQLVNDLMRALQVDRVALGWTHGVGVRGEGESIRVTAISDTEQIDRRLAMVKKLQGAMDECLDQAQPVLYPAPPERAATEGEAADMLLARAITHAHRELAAGDAKLKVSSLPLRIGDEVVGVITVESAADGAIELGTIELLQAALDLIAPVLRIRKSDDRNLALRAWDDTLRVGGWAVGPKHTAWKLAGIILFIGLLFVTLYKVPYRVEAPVEIEPRVKRTVSIPYDSIIADVPPGIEPGVEVEAGQLLLELDTTEIRLSALDAEAELSRALTAADAAQLQNKQAEAKQALAQAEQARARLDLLRKRIEQGRIVAPIGGTIIAGDPKEMEGASVKLGQGLFEIAPLDDLVVVARVADSDIALVGRSETRGGSFASKAYPARRFDLTVERVVPLAATDEGKNTFEVRARLDETAVWMRPGMEGLAKFDTGERSIAGIASRRIVDTLRLWLWW